jgi:hypothetical protein
MKKDKFKINLVQKNFQSEKIKDNIYYINNSIPNKDLTNKTYYTSNSIPSDIQQYIDIAVTRLNIKCSFLCGQIEEMKKEFCLQLEGITRFLNNKNNSVIFPDLRASANMNSSLNTFNNSISYDKSKIKYNMNKNNSISKNNLENSSEIIPKNGILEKKKLMVKTLVIKKEENKKNSLNRKASRKIEIIEDYNSINNNNNNNNKNLKIKKNKDKKIITKKEKALLILFNNNVLNLKEKINIKYLNKNLYSEIDPVKYLVTSEKLLINETLANLYKETTLELPTVTSFSNISFLLKENIENELMKDDLKNNKLFFEALFILKSLKFNKNDKNRDLLLLLLHKTNHENIKNLFINLLKNIKFTIKKIKIDVLINFIDYIENNKILIEQNDLIENKNLYLSYFSFGLNDIFEICKLELIKRDKIITLQAYSKEVEKFNIKNIF